MIEANLRHTGFGPATLDSAGALAMVTASGVPADVAVELVGAAAIGVMEGAAERQKAQGKIDGEE